MLPVEHLQFSELFKIATWNFVPILKRIILLIVLIVMVKALADFLFFQFNQDLIKWLINISAWFIILYLWCVSLLITDQYWKKHSFTVTEAGRKIFAQSLSIFLALMVFIVVILGLFFVAKYILFYFPKSILSVILVSIPLFFFMIFFYFAIPLIVLDQLPWWKSFVRSLQLVHGKNGWRSSAMYFFAFMIFIALLPSSRHMQWLSAHFLNIPFAIFVFSIALPIYNNLIVLQINDMKIMEQQKQSSI